MGDFSKMPDRELDAEVAERMGWRQLHHDGPIRLYGWRHNGANNEGVPFYSSTWAGAGEVLEWAFANGFGYAFGTQPDEMADAAHGAEFWRGVRHGESVRREAPRAIAEAFCETVPLPDSKPPSGASLGPRNADRP